MYTVQFTAYCILHAITKGILLRILKGRHKMKNEQKKNHKVVPQGTQIDILGIEFLVVFM